MRTRSHPKPIEPPIDYWVWLSTPILLSLICVISPGFVTSVLRGKPDFSVLSAEARQKAEAIGEFQELAQTSFDAAMQFTAHWEGGWANHAEDGGGATNYGIASRYNPDVDVSSLTPEGAKQVIRDRYWDAANCDQEPTQELATICLDTAVMHGVGGWKEFKAEVTHISDPAARAKALVENRKAYRYQRVNEAPSQRKFLQGWLNRDKALEQEVSR